MTTSSNIIPHRPNRPITIRCGYESTTRRVTFPSAATCRLESLRLRVEECFHLSASPFFFTYTDDDGEEFSIRSEADLTEAIVYFVSGDDEQLGSAYSGNNGNTAKLALPAQKINLRLEVVVEYDGPSLSDTSSILSGRSGLESDERTSEGSWTSSGYTESYRSYARSGRVEPLVEVDEGLSDLDGSVLSEQLRAAMLDDHRQAGPLSGRGSSGGTAHASQRPPGPPTLTGPDSAPAPSLLTHSELGSRWLQEQSRLVRRGGGPGSRRLAVARGYGSDEEEDSDDESRGDFSLVRDARGKYYYSYQSSEADSLALDSDDHAIGRSASPTPPSGPDATFLAEPVRVAEPAGPPILAPDCSACGMRLEYMRYACNTCGEGQMWRENAPDKGAFVPPRLPSVSDGSSESTETDGTGSDSIGSRTVYPTVALRTRSASISTRASPSPPHSESGDMRDGEPARPVGYELCPQCIEHHGVMHAKAAAKLAKAANSRGRRRVGEKRHTFREKIWAAEGWTDVEYNEDTECTMCRSPLFIHRYKCVSCPKFDLCRSCYQKVNDIHPAHAFLLLPDKPVPLAGPSSLTTNGYHARPVLPATQPVRHPGTFCHNCMQDIVGPRFHCAVCPSWDLCIQCEGVVVPSGASGHTADHIMMKIPMPLDSAEVEAVSRRARDRWFAQDLSTVAADNRTGSTTRSSRSSSPTNETVYGGGSRDGPNRIANTAAGDALDHGCRCSNCDEWIMGRRYQCANCPSDPVAYNLCSICELRSYRVHNPSHVFFKFDRPVHFPLKSPQPLLPLLYRARVGDIPAGAVVDPRNPTSYLQHVLHKETLCDIHSDQIRGIWYRCAHCAAGFDVCQDAEQTAEHDPTHVFVVLKARVDMGAFRRLADLGSTHSKPLLYQQVYQN